MNLILVHILLPNAMAKVSIQVADPSNVILQVSGAQLKPYIDHPDEYVGNYPLDDSILPLPPWIT